MLQASAFSVSPRDRPFVKMKFALLTDALPPLWSGQALVIERLLRRLDANDYCLISRFKPTATDTGARDEGQQQQQRRLPARQYYLPWEPLLRGQQFGLARFHRPTLYTLASRMSGRRIARLLRRERCEAVVACTDNLLDLPAGYFASRAARVPFYAYIFDDYGRKWLPPAESAFARHIEPRVLRGAAGIIVPNEFMRDELRARYGVKSIVIHNPCDVAQYENAETHDARTAGAWLSSTPETNFRIVYTGAVYDAHYDAFRNLLAALDLLPPDAGAKLHVYTSFDHEKLMAQGLTGAVEYHPHGEPQGMPRLQREADALFLPLSFASPYPEVVRTSAPGKLGEYLAARRPVIVHAPADSFVSWYFRQHECGLVVDESDPAKLAEAIERLRADADLRARLSRNAWTRAIADFSVGVAQSRFAELLKVKLIG